MDTWKADLLLLIQRDLDSAAKEIGMFPDDTTIWQAAPGITNSAGNLVLHICGNLNHFIGHELGGSDYIREREIEFNRNSGSRDELFELISTAKTTVTEVLPNLSEEVLIAKFPIPVGGVELRCGLFLMHLATHLAHHVGQLGYLRRIVTGENKSSYPQSLKALAG